MTDDLKTVLAAKLDDANPDHWTEDNEPRLDVARKVSGNPKLTRADIVATGRVRNMVSDAKPVAVDTAELVNQAGIALQAARERVTVARADLLAKRKAQANAIQAWTASHKIKTAESVHRENIERSQARLLAIARGEIVPDASEPPRPASHLDAVMSGYRGSADRGYRRQPGRLPSES